MYISTGNYSFEAAQILKKSEDSSTKSLVDYMNEDNKDSSGYFSDKVQLSPGAYAAISANNPEMLKSLGYGEDENLIKNSTGSSLDKIELSKEAYAALLKSNPEVLKSLGYELPEE
ncbi:MAG: hypothetical protein C0602_10280 [Denitrovibrio sp.]|nr:MAG: hypothetical protein C0602_10280 [Denitrovibrio sp.]